MLLKAPPPHRTKSGNTAHETFTGNRALAIEEALIFEIVALRPAALNLERADQSQRQTWKIQTPRRDWLACAPRAGHDAPLCAPLAYELRD